ncbi:MAG: hypothetical protein PHI98_12730 [Eubacteriales bacterium]|nr:hypothetical protein [Eubacteriales bacterium]
MRKIGAWLLVLFLFSGFSASAETLSVPVWIGDSEMQVTMERYENGMGVFMAYDPAYFFVDSENREVVYFAQTPTAFLSFQNLDNISIEEATDGLTLQAKTDEFTVNDATLGGLFSDSIPVIAVLYEKMVEDLSYQHAFYLVARGANTLMVECYYPTTIDMVVGAELTAMLQTITLQDNVTPTVTARTNASPQIVSNRVQCEICGEWFEAGNEFRNHQCVSYPEESSNLVQCEICGEWFEAGNEFRNHQCVSYPEENSNRVQCKICGEWFEAGNEFRNHQCVSYPSANDRVETYPSEDNISETYPSDENETYPQE